MENKPMHFLRGTVKGMISVSGKGIGWLSSKVLPIVAIAAIVAAIAVIVCAGAVVVAIAVLALIVLAFAGAILAQVVDALIDFFAMLWEGIRSAVARKQEQESPQKA